MELAVQSPTRYEDADADADAILGVPSTATPSADDDDKTSEDGTRRVSSCCSAYGLVRSMSTVILRTFFRSVETSGLENVPRKGATIFVGNHSNQFVDALVLLSQLPRDISFLIAQKSMNRPVIGHVARALRSVPVVRAQDVAVPGEGVLTRVCAAPPDTPGVAEATRGLLHVLVRGSGARFQSQATLRAGAQLRVKCLVTPVPAPSDDGIQAGAAVGSGAAVRVAVATSASTQQTVAVHMRVVQVLSDDELVASVRDAAEQALFPLAFAADGDGGGTHGDGKYKVLPKLDQAQVFAKVLETLAADSSAIGIFPEGGSHDRTELLPLKPGVVLMALESHARGTPVNIVPCGINYFAGHSFRQGRVLVQIGRPIRATAEQVARYRGGEEKRAVSAELLQQVAVGLRTVWLHAPSYIDMKVARMARRLYVPTDLHLEPGAYFELSRRFIEGGARLRAEHADVRDAMASVGQYMQELYYHKLSDRDVAQATKRQASGGCCPSLVAAMANVLVLLVLVPIAAPFMLLNLPIIALIDRLGAAEKKRALAGSQVKLKGLDVVASHNIKVGFVLFPIFYALCAIGAGVALHVTEASPQLLSHLLPLALFLGLGPASFGALRVFEYAIGSYLVLNAMLKSCGEPADASSGSAPAVARLVAERRRLQQLIRALVEKYFTEAAEAAGFRASPSARIVSADALRKDSTSTRSMSETEDLIDALHDNSVDALSVAYTAGDDHLSDAVII